MRTMISGMAVLALASCGAPEQHTAPETESAPSAKTTPPEAASLPDPAQADQAAAIPGWMHGRWALVPADCTTEEGDSKGLIVVNASQIEYYESVGKLAQPATRTSSSLRGQFAFTGEGMEWTRDMEWTLGPAPKTLVQRSFDDAAQPEPLTYARCA